LVIRAAQMKVFEQTGRLRFEDQMVAHSRQFSPRLCEVLGDRQLRLAVGSAIARAKGYGFTFQGPIRLFIELMFLCGGGFDTDPQYSVLGEILRESGDQMQRAERIHEASLDYLEKVSGPGAENVHQALRGLLAMARTPLEFSNDFTAVMLQHMDRVFPEKTAYIGESALQTLIGEAVVEARRYKFEPGRQTALLVVLKFAFGHSCTDDLLYPWISRTLRDARIVSPGARADRLERKAVTWLDRVVARNELRSQP
jgi:hypothetical protein